METLDTILWRVKNKVRSIVKVEDSTRASAASLQKTHSPSLSAQPSSQDALLPRKQIIMICAGGFCVDAWSKAGIASCVQVSHCVKPGCGAKPPLNVLFDIGIFNEASLRATHVFVTHGHTDHCGALFSHARARALIYGSPATYVVPPACLAPLLAAKAAFEALDSKPLAAIFVALAPGENIGLGNGYFGKAVPTTHRVPSQGYVISLRRRAKLTLAQRGTRTSAEIAAAIKSGALVLAEEETIEFAVTGDTTLAGVLAQPEAFLSAPVLIMEVTYLDATVTVDAAHATGHVHLAEVVAHARDFDRVKQLIPVHMSSRYGHHDITAHFAAQLPPALLRRSVPALGAFGGDARCWGLATQFVLPRRAFWRDDGTCFWAGSPDTPISCTWGSCADLLVSSGVCAAVDAVDAPPPQVPAALAASHTGTLWHRARILYDPSESLSSAAPAAAAAAVAWVDGSLCF